VVCLSIELSKSPVLRSCEENLQRTSAKATVSKLCQALIRKIDKTGSIARKT